MYGSHKSSAVVSSVAAVALVAGSLAIGATYRHPANTTHPTVITFDAGTYTGTAEKALIGLIAQFNRTHPRIEVKLTQIPFSNYDPTLETQFRAGAGPDVMLVNFVDLAAWKQAGYLANLTPLMKASHAVESGYSPKVYKEGTFDGEQYGLPVDMDVRALFYNKVEFAKYNLVPPTNWNQMLNDAKILHQHGIYGLSADLHNYWSGVWEDSGNFLLSNGGAILNKSGTSAIAANDPQTVQAYEFFFDKFRSYFPPGLSDMSSATDESLFAAGKLGMFEDGPWFATGIEQDNSKMVFNKTYGIVPLPVSPYTGKSVSSSGGFFVGISKLAKYTKQDWVFVNWMTQPRLSAQLAVAFEDMPARPSAFKDAPFNTALYHVFLSAIPEGVATVHPLVPELSAVVSDLWKQLQLIASNTESVKEGLEKFDSEADVVLKLK